MLSVGLRLFADFVNFEHPEFTSALGLPHGNFFECLPVLSFEPTLFREDAVGSINGGGAQL
jgi:hypothetical protein